MPQHHDVDRMIGAISLIALHEIDVLTQHWQLLGDCWVGVRRARDWRELRVQQRNLSRSLRRRRPENRRIRHELWHGLYQDVRGR